jgi:3-oxoacyl-[acyl-carrier protein] reductase
MAATSDWTLEPVREAERPLLLRLFEHYLHDFSEMEHADVDEDGLFVPPALPFVERHWTEPECHAFLLRVAGKPAGFALLRESSPIAGSADRRYLSGFFVARAYRRRGYGETMARALFARFPGPWQVLEVRDNPGAQAFWRRVVGEATGNRFTERWLNGREIVQEFEIPTETTSDEMMTEKIEESAGKELTGNVAIVTGAGSGVGRAAAIALADAGAIPVLVGRTREPLEETASLIADAGGASLVIPADVTDEAAVGDLFTRAASELGGIDTVILAAGIGLYGPIEDYALADWEATLATNLSAPFLCSRAAIPYLRQRGGGAIIAISSGAGKQGYPQLAAYSASKFGLMGFMQSLAAEVATDGIKVSTVVPGSILTPFGGRPVAEKRQAMADDPGRKYLEPEDVSEAILFLLGQPRRAWTQELNVWPF